MGQMHHRMSACIRTKIGAACTDACSPLHCSMQDVLWGTRQPTQTHRSARSHLAADACAHSRQVRDMDPEMLKVLGRTLRFVAHTNGATLVYLSNLHAGAAAANASADKPLLDNFSKLMNHLVFTGLEKKPALKVWMCGQTATCAWRPVRPHLARCAAILPC